MAIPRFPLKCLVWVGVFQSLPLLIWTRCPWGLLLEANFLSPRVPQAIFFKAVTVPSSSTFLNFCQLHSVEYLLCGGTHSSSVSSPPLSLPGNTKPISRNQHHTQISGQQLPHWCNPSRLLTSHTSPPALWMSLECIWHQHPAQRSVLTPIELGGLGAGQGGYCIGPGRLSGDWMRGQVVQELWALLPYPSAGNMIAASTGWRGTRSFRHRSSWHSLTVNQRCS